MVSIQTQLIVEAAKRLYVTNLQVALESDSIGKFVAIEPISQDYFVSDTFDGAVRASREKHPTRLCHVIRVGHIATFHIGRLTR
jgi:hypothetical protein